MFVDDGRKEETRGAGRQLLLRDWVLLSLTWGRICTATVSAEQDGNKGAGWSASRGIYMHHFILVNSSLLKHLEFRDLTNNC